MPDWNYTEIKLNRKELYGNQTEQKTAGTALFSAGRSREPPDPPGRPRRTGSAVRQKNGGGIGDQPPYGSESL